MKGPNALLKFVGKAALNAVGGGFLGDLAIDVLPDVAKDVWDWWGKKKSPQERQAEVEKLAQLPADQLEEAVVEVVEEVAADQPVEVKQALATYLTQVPAAIRRSLRRPADPSGSTVPPERTVQNAKDLLPFLPTRLPRFKPGDRPLPNVDYELIELLGVGGFGEVWKAYNPDMDSLPPVALKFCLDDSVRDQLLRHEATVLNQVMREGRHPGIVPLQHTFLRGEKPCLAYEYVSGGDLASVITQMHRQADKDMKDIIDQAANLIAKLSEIVAFAHRLTPPIVHRDLKPANVLVQRTSDDDFKLRVADFGIGGVVATQKIQQTQAVTGKGQYEHSVVRGAYTPLYASPQQTAGEPPDPRDDVHALGIVWYQMVVGDMSKGCPGGSAWAKKLKEQGMSKGMLDLLTACFEEDPDDRPADAGELVERLHALKRTRPPKKGDEKPVLELDASEAKTFERYAAAKVIYEEAKEEMEKQKEHAQRILWRRLLQLWQERHEKPENPKIVVPGKRAEGVAQIRDVLKVDLPEDQNLSAALLAAGFSKECTERIISSEVEVESELTLRSPSDLGKSNPDLLSKIKTLLQKDLSPAERDEAFVRSVGNKVKKDFLKRASDYACSEEELFKLLEIIRPQFTLTSITYKGDLEKVFSEIHGKKDRVALKKTERAEMA